MAHPGPDHSNPNRRDMQKSPSERLARAWQDGQIPGLESFVAGLSEVSPEELATLIRIDLAARWKRGDRRPPEVYFELFPSVTSNTDLAVDVIYAEYLIREQSGEGQQLAEYQQRFPTFATVLIDQIRLHQAIEAIDNNGQTEPTEPDQIDGSSEKPNDDPSNLEVTYEILEQIGSGGMGVVYRARQPALDRLVALKMVRAIDADNPDLLARFRSEARVIAALQHPHIVQVYDFGEHEGLPYIAMELITKGSLADRLDGTPWDPRIAAELVAKLAAAVQFAHEHQVIHRDLKPANVLVVNDDKELTVKVTDFGLARFLVDDSQPHTKSFTFLGTPSYMAPEQATGSPRDIGPAADVYSLGAILYELLTGQPPIRGESPIETLRLLLSSEPVSIHCIDKKISRDLATICDKCLQRDGRMRYSSAAELHADLERYLEGRPIHARPIGKAERMWRWCRRNPLLAGALGCVAMLLLVIAAVLLRYSGALSREVAKTRSAEQAEREANETAQQRLWDMYLSEAIARNASHEVGQRSAALESIDKAIGLLEAVGRSSERERELRNAVLSAVALPDLRQVRLISKVPADMHGCTMSISADCYVVASEDGVFTGRRLSDNRQIWTIETVESRTEPILSPDGQTVVALGAHGAKVWRVDGAEPRLAWEAPNAQFFTFAPDGKVACYSDSAERMQLVRTRDGTTVRTIGKGAARSKFAYHVGTNRIAVRGVDGLQVIDAGTGKAETEFPIGTSAEPLLDWHPSGEYLAVWGSNDEISLWNVKTHAKVLSFPLVGNPARLRFSRDGSMLVSQTMWNQRLCVWDVGTGQRLLEVPEFVSQADNIGPEGKIQFLTRRGVNLELMELHPGICRTLAKSLSHPLGYWHHASISPEGRIVALSSLQGLELWDLLTGQRLFSREIGQCVANFDTQGRLTIGCPSGVYRFLPKVETITRRVGDSPITMNASDNRTVVRFHHSERLTKEILDPACSATNSRGETLVFQDEHGWALKQLDRDTKIVRLSTKDDPRTSAVSDDNRFVAIANWENNGATVWDGKSGEFLANIAAGPHGIVQFSPDSRLLVTTPDGVTVWRTNNWQRICQLHAEGTTPTGLGVAFSPDSRVLAVGSIHGVLRLNDPLTGNEWSRLSRLDFSGASTIAFSTSQQSLIASSLDEHSPTLVWDLVAMRHELANRGLDLPTDVLRASASPKNVEERFEVVFDDIDLIR